MKVIITGTQAYYCFELLNSGAITTAVTSLSTFFTAHQITEIFKLNSRDILVSQMNMEPHGPNSNFLLFRR
jgi:hypothetical protein